MKKRMWKTLEATCFSGCPIVAVAAKPGGSEVYTLFLFSSHFFSYFLRQLVAHVVCRLTCRSV